MKKPEYLMATSDTPAAFPPKFRTCILYFIQAEKSRKYGDFTRFMHSIKILNLGRDYGDKEKNNTLKKRERPHSRRIP